MWTFLANTFPPFPYPGHPDKPYVDYTKLVVSALCIWSFMMYVHPMRTVVPNKTSLTRTILTIPELICAMLTVILGMGLFAISMMPEKAMNSLLVQKVFYTSICASLYLAFNTFYLRTFYVVKNGTLIILDGKVLLPGTEFRLHPLIKYKVERVEREIKVDSSIKITCLDGDYNVGYHSLVHIEIEKMSLDHTPILDPEKLKRHAEEWVSYVLHRSAQHTTLGKFLTEPSEHQSTELDGIPVSWDGKKNLVFMQHGAMLVEQL